MGAKTTYIPGGELYTALATGVVDGGHWGPPGPMYDMKFQEVLKFIIQPDPIAAQFKGLHVNLDLWNSLSPDDQALLTVAAEATLNGRAVRTVKILDTKALQSMVNDFGVTIFAPPPEELSKMRQASMEVWDDLAKKDPVNAKVIAKLKDYLKELGYK